eukprot:g2205.t1
MGGLISMWLSTMYNLPTMENDMEKALPCGTGDVTGTANAIRELYIISFLGMGFGVLPGYLIDVLGPSLTTLICSFCLMLGMAGTGGGLLLNSPALLYPASFLYGNGSKGVCLASLCVVMRVVPGEWVATVCGVFMMLDAFSGITMGAVYDLYKNHFTNNADHAAATFFIGLGVFLGCLGGLAGATFWMLYEKKERERQLSGKEEVRGSGGGGEEEKPPGAGGEEEEKKPLLQIRVHADDEKNEAQDGAVDNYHGKINSKAEEGAEDPSNKAAPARQMEKVAAAPAAAPSDGKGEDQQDPPNKTNGPQDQDQACFPRSHMLIGVVCLAVVMFFGTSWGMCYNKQVKNIYEAAFRAKTGLLNRSQLYEITEAGQRFSFSLLKARSGTMNYKVRWVRPGREEDGRGGGGVEGANVVGGRELKPEDFLLWEWPDDTAATGVAPARPLTARFESYSADDDVITASILLPGDGVKSPRTVEIDLRHVNNDLPRDEPLYSTKETTNWRSPKFIYVSDKPVVFLTHHEADEDFEADGVTRSPYDLATWSSEERAFYTESFNPAFPVKVFIACNGIGRFVAGLLAEPIGKCTVKAIYFPAAMAVFVALFGFLGFGGAFPSSPASVTALTVSIGLAFGAMFAMMPIYLKTIVPPQNMGVMFGASVLALVSGNYVWYKVPLPTQDYSDVWHSKNVSYRLQQAVRELEELPDYSAACVDADGSGISSAGTILSNNSSNAGCAAEKLKDQLQILEKLGGHGGKQIELNEGCVGSKCYAWLFQWGFYLGLVALGAGVAMFVVGLVFRRKEQLSRKKEDGRDVEEEAS